MPRNVSVIHIGLVVVLAVWMLGTSCAPASTPSGSVIKIEISASSIQVNDTVRMSIKAESIADLTAMEVHLSFNPSVLEVTELIAGEFIKADFTVQNTFDNSAGTIDYAVAQLDRSPAGGSGTLFEIVFHAKAGGDSPINFRGTEAAPAGALFSDSNGAAIQVSLTNATVKVSK